MQQQSISTEKKQLSTKYTKKHQEKQILQTKTATSFWVNHLFLATY